MLKDFLRMLMCMKVLPELISESQPKFHSRNCTALQVLQLLNKNPRESNNKVLVVHMPLQSLYLANIFHSEVISCQEYHIPIDFVIWCLFYCSPHHHCHRIWGLQWRSEFSILSLVCLQIKEVYRGPTVRSELSQTKRKQGLTFGHEMGLLRISERYGQRRRKHGTWAVNAFLRPEHLEE